MCKVCRRSRTCWRRHRHRRMMPPAAAPRPPAPQTKASKPWMPQPERPSPERPQPERPQTERPQPERPQPERPQPERPKPMTANVLPVPTHQIVRSRLTCAAGTKRSSVLGGRSSQPGQNGKSSLGRKEFTKKIIVPLLSTPDMNVVAVWPGGYEWLVVDVTVRKWTEMKDQLLNYVQMIV